MALVIKFEITCNKCGGIHPVYLLTPPKNWPNKLPCPMCNRITEYTVRRV